MGGQGVLSHTVKETYIQSILDIYLSTVINILYLHVFIYLIPSDCLTLSTK